MWLKNWRESPAFTIHIGMLKVVPNHNNNQKHESIITNVKAGTNLSANIILVICFQFNLSMGWHILAEFSGKGEDLNDGYLEAAEMQPDMKFVHSYLNKTVKWEGKPCKLLW